MLVGLPSKSWNDWLFEIVGAIVVFADKNVINDGTMDTSGTNSDDGEGIVVINTNDCFENNGNGEGKGKPVRLVPTKTARLPSAPPQ